MMFRETYIKNLILFLVFFIFAAGSQSLAQNLNNTTSQKPLVESKDCEQNLSWKEKNLELEKLLLKHETTSSEKIKNLEQLVEAQKSNIRTLELKIEMLKEKPLTNGSTFEVWSSIVLGASALIVTTLGVGIAILTFIGYDQLVNKGAKKAEDKAVAEAQKIIPDLVSEKTIESLQSLIDKGHFDPIVEEIMQKIAYRNIGFGDDAPN